MLDATLQTTRAAIERCGKVVRALVAIVLGVISAELCVRLATNSSIDRDSIFSPGPYCADEELGFTSVCPNAHGIMRIPSTRIYSSFQKNGLGFRGPYKTASANQGERTQKIVFIGGQSQGFGFGLNEQDTFAAVAAEHACHSVEIQNVGLIGTPNAISFYQFVKNGGDPGDHVIVMIYEPGWSATTLIPWQRWWGERIALLDGWHFPVPSWLPAAARKSQIIVRAFQRSGEVASFVGKAVGSAHAASGEPKSVDSSTTMDSVREIERYTISHGAKFTVFVLPGPADQLSPRLQDALPNVDIVDFAAEFEQSGGQKFGPPESYGPEGYFFVDGHFNKRMTEKIGKRIAQILCSRN